MKTMKPYVKVAGILFLMYFHLMLIAAIGIKQNQGNRLETRTDNPDVPAQILEPPAPIEAWMLDVNYLKK